MLLDTNGGKKCVVRLWFDCGSIVVRLWFERKKGCFGLFEGQIWLKKCSFWVYMLFIMYFLLIEVDHGHNNLHWWEKTCGSIVVRLWFESVVRSVVRKNELQRAVKKRFL